MCWCCFVGKGPWLEKLMKMFFFVMLIKIIAIHRVRKDWAVCCMQFNLWMCHCLDWCVYCSVFKIKLTISMISRKGNFHFDKWTKTKIVENLRGTVSKFPYPQALFCFLCACMQMIIHTRLCNTRVMIPFF